MFKKINQNRILILVLILAALTCSLQAAPYTTNSPLILGMDTNPILGGGTRTYTGMVVHMLGNFTLMPSGNTVGAWQPGAPANENGGEFWDGNSLLSSQAINIGNYVYGNEGFTGNLSSPGWTPATAQYWGTGSGGSASFYFQQNSGGNQANMTVEISLLASITSLAWYDTTAPNVLYNIFTGSSTAGSTASFTPTASWGLISNGAYRSTNNTAVAGFSPWQGPPDQGVPEPGTFLTMAAGLIALGKLYHRRLGQ
ncbi:MAG: hypothetical protein RL292_129 [Candidatus Parcubacteria bacterium]|jgi:hypothetical protein